MPSPFSIEAELDIWHNYWSNYHDTNELLTTIIGTLKVILYHIGSFPNISKALKILAVIPLTSCECERCISQLRLLKTYTRNTVCEDRFQWINFPSHS